MHVATLGKVQNNMPNLQVVPQLFSLCEILPFIIEHETVTIANKYLVRLNSPTLKAIAKKGIKCARCGIEGSFFKLSRYQNQDSFFPSLVAIGNDGREQILMTRDHINPKCNGGTDRYSNIQILCEKCNNLKNSHTTNYAKITRRIAKHLELVMIDMARHTGTDPELIIKNVRNYLISRW